MGVFKAGSGEQPPHLQARVEQAKAEARRQRAEREAEKEAQLESTESQPESDDEMEWTQYPLLPRDEDERKKSFNQTREDLLQRLDQHLAELTQLFEDAENLEARIQTFHEDWPHKSGDERATIIYKKEVGTSCLGIIDSLRYWEKLTPEQTQRFIEIIARVKKSIPKLQEMEIAVPKVLWEKEEYFAKTCPIPRWD